MTKIETIIYEGLCRHEAQQIPRGYLGMSSLGKPCVREAWYGWRQTTGSYTDGRILMLFDTGHHVEAIVCRAMRLAGFVLRHAFPDQQISFSDCGGFLSGHPDGIIEDSEGDMILEIKSSNTNKFKSFQEKGVREIYPAYYAQMQLYMYYAKLSRALFIVMKKDDSQLYTEIVPFDGSAIKQMLRKAAYVLQSHEDNEMIRVPSRISEDPASEDCKWCRYRTICHEPDQAIQTIQSCRSCAFFHMGPDFAPFCGHKDHQVRLKDVSRACQQWTWVMQVPWFIDEISF